MKFNCKRISRNGSEFLITSFMNFSITELNTLTTLKSSMYHSLNNKDSYNNDSSHPNQQKQQYTLILPFVRRKFYNELAWHPLVPELYFLISVVLYWLILTVTAG